VGVDHNLHLGPYAQWLIEPQEIASVLRGAAFWAEIEGKLGCNWSNKLPPKVSVDGVTYHQFCFLPFERRPGEPKREFVAADIAGVQDLRGISAKAEMDWFVEAFGPELEAVTQGLGRPPTLHWGIVGWE
jgi:hypothetical protein